MRQICLISRSSCSLRNSDREAACKFRTIGVWLILALSIFEGMAAALTEPALHSFLTTSVAGEAVGRAEGVTLAAGAAAAGVGAILGGYLFGIGPNVPLYAAALLGVLPCLLLPVFWRGLPGRTAPSG